MRGCSLLAFAFICAIATGARAQSTFTVSLTGLTDEKAVFATVESPYVVPARARIDGTIATLSVRQGDAVKEGQVIAVVGDEKLLLKISSLDAQIAGLQSQLAEAQTELMRAEMLYRSQAGSKAAYDQARTAVDVASSALRARTAERAQAQQNLEEGQVLAPVAGRVLTVPFTQGTVVMNGNTIATIGEEPFRLRLRLPERHAVVLKAGDPIRLAAHQLGADPGQCLGSDAILIFRRDGGGAMAAAAATP